jgi:chitin synthase
MSGYTGTPYQLPMPTLSSADEWKALYAGTRSPSIRPISQQDTSSSGESFHDAQDAPEVASLPDSEAYSSLSTAASEATIVDPRAPQSRLQKFPYARQPMLQQRPGLQTIQSGRPLSIPPVNDPFSDRTAPSTPARQSATYGQLQFNMPPAPQHLAPTAGGESGGIRARTASSGYSPVDHFRYDTEGYASGRASGAAWRTPESRSPTPGHRTLPPQGYVPPNLDYSPTPAARGLGGRGYTAVDDDDDSEGEDDDDLYDEDKYTYGYNMPLGTGGDEGEEEDRWSSGEKTPPLDGKPPPVTGPPEGWTPVMHPDAPLVLPPLDDDPHSPETTKHFGPAPPGRAHRRNKALKRVRLKNGNLVLDLDVPPKLVLPWKGESEMQTTRSVPSVLLRHIYADTKHWLSDIRP